jgi:hypothetical protein
MKTALLLIAAATLAGCAWASSPTYTGRTCWSKLIEVPERSNPEYDDGWSSLTVTCGTAEDFEIAKSNGMMVWKRMRVLETIQGWREKSTDSTRKLPVVSSHYRWPLPEALPPGVIAIPYTSPKTSMPLIAGKDSFSVCIERHPRNATHLICRWYIRWREDYSECVNEATKYEVMLYNEYFPSCEK